MAGLYPNTPFTDGSIFTPDLADLAMEAPIFDDQPQYKGHRVRILDSELSNNPGQIKDRVAKLTDNLKLSVVSGLTLAYTSGSVRLPDGAIQAIPANQIVVPDNTTSYIWINSAGQVAAGDVPPVSRVLLGKATAVSGTVTILEDLRSGAGIPEVRPMARSIRSFGGWGDEGDYVATNGAVLDQGEYYFSSFTVPAGISITVDKMVKIHTTKDVVIDGTINVSPAVGGAATGVGLAYALPPYTTVGGDSGIGFGAGRGEYAEPPYNYLISPLGSSGSSGYMHNFSNILVEKINPSKGGAGGGNITIQAAGNILITGTINASGGAGANYMTFSDIWVGGAGGGSGGSIILQSLTKIVVSPSASLVAKGGQGGKGLLSTGDGTLLEHGSGGGGGYIILYAPLIVTTGAILDVGGGDIGTYDNIPNPNLFAPGGSGGSFGGLGGHNAGLGVAGNPGVIIIRQFTPIG